MELEQSTMMTERHDMDNQTLITITWSNPQTLITSSTTTISLSSSSPPPPTRSVIAADMLQRMESFRILENELPKSNSGDIKLSWLRSQIIGSDEEFESPFGTRLLTYADHTASGRSLSYIENYIVNNVLPFYGNSHTSDSYVGQRTTKTVHEASEYVKRCLGGTDNDAIIFCGSGTTAAIKRLQEVMAIAIPSPWRETVIKAMNPQERWVVFVGPYEHHSNILSWRQSLAEVIEIGLDKDGLVDVKSLKAKLGVYQNTNRPMLGSFSACSNVTGIYSDTRALARLLHQFGAFACFDFAASGPYVEIDMRSGEIDGYDAVFLSPHKFIGGPDSPGILLMSKALYQLRNSPPSTCGGGTVDFVNPFSEKDTLYAENIEEREDAGTPPIIQKVRAALAFWVKEYIGYSTIEQKEHHYIQRAFERLLPNQNISVLGNTTAKRQAIFSFLVYTTSHSDGNGLNMWSETGNIKDKPLHGPFVAKLLNDLFGIQSRGGCACAGPYGHSLLGVDEPKSLAFRAVIQKGYLGVKPGWTRISFPYYMSNEEFEFILAAVEFIAVYGQRFLHMYHFNWKKGAWSIKKKVLRESLLTHHSSCKMCNLSTTNMAATTGNDGNDQGHSDEESSGVIRKYWSYLKSAKHIASLLPKFPPKRNIPEEIEPSLVPFRV
ncbi:probable cysteine desulfurase [Impatiens glandulifera]|uniref:probable cysteine desulfurase n=1 Tax=Impatiens glandulifera TaxID=253017 RepID=UPI001FB1514B|nr:probable cysteine desulfurase [Impatiens glandulifera]